MVMAVPTLRLRMDADLKMVMAVPTLRLRMDAISDLAKQQFRPIHWVEFEALWCSKQERKRQGDTGSHTIALGESGTK